MFVSGNKQLIKRYPFLLPRQYHIDAPPDGYNYRWTELDSLPEGWCCAFGLEMVEDLREILLSADYLNEYRIIAISIDFGCLCWFDNGYPKTIMKEMAAWEAKYRQRSAYTCVGCGKPATHIMLGWIMPFCEDCIKDVTDNPEQCPPPEEWYRPWIKKDTHKLLYRKYPRTLW